MGSMTAQGAHWRGLQGVHNFLPSPFQVTFSAGVLMAEYVPSDSAVSKSLRQVCGSMETGFLNSWAGYSRLYTPFPTWLFAYDILPTSSTHSTLLQRLRNGDGPPASSTLYSLFWLPCSYYLLVRTLSDAFGWRGPASPFWCFHTITTCAQLTAPHQSTAGS